MSDKRTAQRSDRNTFKEIASTLQARIQSGALPVGRYLPTERELQLEFGVSRSTIRRALQYLVESGSAQSVPSKGVIALGGGRKTTSRNIALIDAQTYVLQVLYFRIGELLQQKGYHLIHLGHRIHHSIEQAFQYANDHGFAGILVWSYEGFPDTEIVGKVTRKIPTVAMDHGMRGLELDLVTTDYFKAAYELVNHLAKQGRRRIAVAGMLDMLDITQDRFSAYMKALFDNGLTPNSSDYLFTMTSGQLVDRTEALTTRLKASDRPDAIFVMQDEWLPGVTEAVLKAGLSIPKDVAIVTLGGDIDLTVDGIGMTATVIDWDAMAREAVELLLNRLENPSRKPIKKMVDHQLVIRGLCGAPNSKWTAQPGEHYSLIGNLPYPRPQYAFRTGTDLLVELPSANRGRLK